MRYILLCSIFIISCTTFDKTKKDNLRPYNTFKLSNGLEVLTIEDRSLPYIDVALLVAVGTSSEDKNNNGITNLVGNLLTAGTKNKTKEEVVNSFALLGTELSVSVAKDYTLLVAGSLSNDQTKLYSILSEVVSESSFVESEILKSKSKIISDIEKMPDEPRGFSKKLYDDFLFGKSSYALDVLGSKDSLQKITSKQVVDYYKKHFVPSNAILAVVGNFSSTFSSDLEKAFGSWRSDKMKISKIVRTPAYNLKGHEVRLVGKDDLVQSQLKLGSVGIHRANEDFLKLQVAGTILGKGFSSRLMERIRNQLGLTYYISSSFESFMYTGSFVVDTFTKNNTVRKTIDEILLILSDFHNNGVTVDELKMAKDYLIGVFPQELDTAFKQALNLVSLKFYGIDQSYLTDYTANVEALSLADVNGAIKKYIDPKKLRILVYGDVNKVRSQLKGIGSLDVVSLD